LKCAEESQIRTEAEAKRRQSQTALEGTFKRYHELLIKKSEGRWDGSRTIFRRSSQRQLRSRMASDRVPLGCASSADSCPASALPNWCSTWAKGPTAWFLSSVRSDAAIGFSTRSNPSG